jgi:hypothetical protein
MGFRPPLLYLIVISIWSVKRPARHVRHQREMGPLPRVSAPAAVPLAQQRAAISGEGPSGCRPPTTTALYEGTDYAVSEEAFNKCVRTKTGRSFSFPSREKERFLHVSFSPLHSDTVHQPVPSHSNIAATTSPSSSSSPRRRDLSSLFSLVLSLLAKLTSTARMI